MIEFTQDTTPPPPLDLDRMRSAVPSYQRSELPRRLRGEWPHPAGEADLSAPVTGHDDPER